MMREKILHSVRESVEAVTVLTQPTALLFIEAMAQSITSCFREGHKVLIAGNGGSLCDAMHFAEEFTGIFRSPRRALPVIALNDSSHMSCVANDLSFEMVFSRGVQAYGQPGDLFIGLTTSGNSPNIVHAIQTAKAQGLKTIALLGRGGGKLKGVADLELCIDGFATSDRIQEAHMTALHIVIEQVEHLLFSSTPQPVLSYN